MEEREPGRQRCYRLFKHTLTLTQMAKEFTSYTNQAFIKSIIGDDYLDRVVEYIRDNLRPEDVFEDNELAEWANDSGYVKPE